MKVELETIKVILSTFRPLPILAYFFPVFLILDGIHSTARFCIQHEVKSGVLAETTGIAQEGVFLIVVDRPEKNIKFKYDQLQCLRPFLLIFSQLQGNLLLTCTCGTDTHSRHSCHTPQGWLEQTHCSVDTAGSQWTPGSSHKNLRTRSSGWMRRWVGEGQSSPLSVPESAELSSLCANVQALKQKEQEL